MITRPDIRYMLFLCFHELGSLRQTMDMRPLNEWDIAPLIETMNVVGDLVGGDPQRVIGSVLFDRDEAEAIDHFRALPVNVAALQAPF